MERRDWADGLLERVGLTRERVPALVGAGRSHRRAVAGRGRASWASPPGLPVVGGAGDGQWAGARRERGSCPGAAYLNLGTAVVAGTMSERYAWDAAFRTLIGADPAAPTRWRRSCRAGPTRVNWFLERIATLDAAERCGLGLEDVDLLEAAATRLPPGAEGLLLVPYWASAQTPVLGSGRARGAVRPRRPPRQGAHLPRVAGGHRVRAASRPARGWRRQLGQPLEVLLITRRGGSRSALWRQIMADVHRQADRGLPRGRRRPASAPGSSPPRPSGWHGIGARGRRGDDRRGGAARCRARRRRRDTTRCSPSTGRSIPRTAPLHRALQRALDG